jgi:hypothetical protein
MPNPAIEIQATGAGPTIDDGDLAAASGEWQRAVDIWGKHLTTGERAAAASRIRWFLHEASGAQAPPVASRARQDAVVILLVGIGCSIVGTALVLIGENRTGTAQDVLAAIAWTLYISAAVLAVTYAYKVGRTTESVTPPVAPDELKRAAQIAATLDPANAMPNITPDHSPRVMRR